MLGQENLQVGSPRKVRCTGPFLSSQVYRPDRPHQGYYGHANFDLLLVFFLAHRASAAFLATARRSSGVSFRILARTLALPQATKSFLVRGRKSAALPLRRAFATPTTLSSRSGSTKRNGRLYGVPVGLTSQTELSMLRASALLSPLAYREARPKHCGGCMRRAKASTQPVQKAERHPEAQAHLQELLDHLSRLLAREYLRAFTGNAADKAAPEQGR